MKPIRSSRFACVLAGAVVLHGAAAYAVTDKILHAFGAGTDGYEPLVGVLDAHGTLYGTTNLGGAYGYGAVFSINLNTGKERIVYSFGCGASGGGPAAALTNINGELYGTTTSCGSYGYGTVFSVNPSKGTEDFAYSFAGPGTDGGVPQAGLVALHGALYGTTMQGGVNNRGTVFSINLSTGKEAVVHSFGSGTDGYYPQASLVGMGGKLYGTTEYGGMTHLYGTVFSINPNTGTEVVIYSFAGPGTDGANPEAGLINLNDKLYGTTVGGGANDDGAIFSVTPNTGTEKIVYSFAGGTDGLAPHAALIDLNGTLYGTTAEGGGSSCSGFSCGGTVFSINPLTGAKTVLHLFRGGTDGAYPRAGLISVNGTLYGTTEYAGASGCGAYGCGTVFSIRP